VRQKMVDDGLCRTLVNHRINRVRRVFKWAASEELIPAAVVQALATVAGLQRGRTPAPEPEPVAPAPDAHVNAARPDLLPPVRAMVELQRLTGCRPGEVCRMRACELDVTGPLWVWRPGRHKTAWRGKERVIVLGPKAQAVVKPFLTTNLEAYL